MSPGWDIRVPLRDSLPSQPTRALPPSSTWTPSAFALLVTLSGPMEMEVFTFIAHAKRPQQRLNSAWGPSEPGLFTVCVVTCFLTVSIFLQKMGVCLIHLCVLSTRKAI